ncbi:ABC transporter permease [Paenibacillus glufosinatiresistens]|uniref:ABC transporter permease n=1 Tax=Paenibacillus glufosinatiresistens TaxID=3070657 RepID=UPI00286DD2C3|nr:ABC transporter permease [Paenibacillus sp. YX.27]
MRVFELYMKRIIRRRMTLILILVLPIVFTYSVVAQYKQAQQVTLTLYAKDAAVGAYVTGMLEKQDVIVKQADSREEAADSSSNLGVVLTQSASEVYSGKGAVTALKYAKEQSFNSSSLEVKINSVLSVMQTLARNAPDEGAFAASLKKAAEAKPAIEVHRSILGNPNAVVLTSSFNMIVFIIMFLTMTNTMLFLGDKVHTTTQRILLAAYSKLSYYIQTAAVFAVVGVVQFLIMIGLLTAVFRIELTLSPVQLLLLILAYGLLNVVAAGIGLLLVSRTTGNATGRLLISVVCLPMAMLGGTLWPSSIMPESMQRLARILPTNWITEVNAEMFSGFGRHAGEIALHIGSLGVLAVLLFLLLMRVRTENI